MRDPVRSPARVPASSASSKPRKANNGFNGATLAVESKRDVTSSNHRCCAERRWLDACVREARKAGVQKHRLVAYVKRKYGSHISVFRLRSDGTFGCAVPCVWCQKELERFDIRVSFVGSDGRWCDGRVSDGTMPKPVLTAGQRRMLNKEFPL